MRGSPRYATDHSNVQRDCALYRIWGLDPRTNYTTVCLIYIGETAREPFVRFLEHLYDQPFGDTIVGAPQVDPRVFGSKEEVWAAEQAAVEAERPLYNFEFNLGNPDRITIPEARRQRAQRDRAKGLTSKWTESASTAGRRKPTKIAGARPTRPSKPPVMSQPDDPYWMVSRPAMFCYAWLALSVLIGWLLSTYGVLRGTDSVEAGFGAATSLCALLWLGGFGSRLRR